MNARTYKSRSLIRPVEKPASQILVEQQHAEQLRRLAEVEGRRASISFELGRALGSYYLIDRHRENPRARCPVVCVSFVERALCGVCPHRIRFSLSVYPSDGAFRFHCRLQGGVNLWVAHRPYGLLGEPMLGTYAWTDMHQPVDCAIRELMGDMTECEIWLSIEAL